MAGNLSHSMRNNYDTHGVEGYYNLVSESYRNPHYAGLKKVLNEFMDRFMEHEKPRQLNIVDLAAGSGEATEALLLWKNSRWPPPGSAPPLLPARPSSDAPASSSQNSAPLPPSRPPFIPPNHRPPVPRPGKALAVSSLASPTLCITASDPYTASGYRLRTSLPCLELSFNDVAAGQLPPPPQPRIRADHDDGEPTNGKYDIIIVSFALHLVESSSELWALLTELSKRADWLVVMAPHKKPDIKPNWGWTRWDPRRWKAADGRPNEVGGQEGDGWEVVLDRTRLRVWRSDEYGIAIEG